MFSPDQENISASTKVPVKYGELIVLGYNGSLPNGDRGRRKSRFGLCKRPKANGVKPSTVHVACTPQAAKAISNKDQHSISYTLSRAQTVVVEYTHDNNTDMFQIGRSTEGPIDFVVTDTVPGSQSNSDTQSVQSTISRFACRIICERNPPYTARIYAAGFDSSKNIFLGEKAAKWKTSDSQMDGLTTNGVLVMHPRNGFTEDSKPGVWREISVCGNVFTLRETRSAQQRGKMARMDRMEQFQKEREDLEKAQGECKRKLSEVQRKIKELEVSGTDDAKSELQKLQQEQQGLKKEEKSCDKKLEEHRKQEKKMPWNVDTLSKEGFSKSVFNVKPEDKEETEEEKEQKHKTFVEKYEKAIKHFGMLRRWDDSQKYLSDNPHLVCEETANYLVIMCIDLEVEEKHALMEQVAHQTIVMQFILELARSLKVDPRACFRQFFTKIKVENETNELVDGSLVDLCGAALLWRTAEGLAHTPTVKHLEALRQEINAARPQCPVGFNTLAFPSMKRKDVVDEKQPWVYLNCGHVHGYHNWGNKEERDGKERECPMCRSRGPYVPLWLGCEAGFYVDAGPPTHAFSLCGHVCSEKTVTYWSQIPLPHGTHTFHAACPFCAQQLTGEQGYIRLIFQGPVD
ncbi:E3 ubiquitin-protein ligase pellino-like 1 [Acipenser ruthenus]|uniref:E3 ubiquitin-protein ligase pellino-like 1 n=1 Tax=Acipenser ruthenus TaxID=7906 RepID=A0A444U3U1_ACIRT|nr:E3 ubiquitin-protein ligase pellino-like 1 [Acipenser ruthenus]